MAMFWHGMAWHGMAWHGKDMFFRVEFNSLLFQKKRTFDSCTTGRLHKRKPHCIFRTMQTGASASAAGAASAAAGAASAAAGAASAAAGAASAADGASVDSDVLRRECGMSYPRTKETGASASVAGVGAGGGSQAAAAVDAPAASAAPAAPAAPAARPTELALRLDILYKMCVVDGAETGMLGCIGILFKMFRAIRRTVPYYNVAKVHQTPVRELAGSTYGSTLLSALTACGRILLAVKSDVSTNDTATHFMSCIPAIQLQYWVQDADELCTVLGLCVRKFDVGLENIIKLTFLTSGCASLGMAHELRAALLFRIITHGLGSSVSDKAEAEDLCRLISYLWPSGNSPTAVGFAKYLTEWAVGAEPACKCVVLLRVARQALVSLSPSVRAWVASTGKDIMTVLDDKDTQVLINFMLDSTAFWSHTEVEFLNSCAERGAVHRDMLRKQFRALSVLLDAPFTGKAYPAGLNCPASMEAARCALLTNLLL